MLARARVGGTGEVVQLVVPVEVDLVRGAAEVCARQQLVGDVGHPCRRQQRDEPIVVTHDSVQDRARRDVSGPTDHRRNPVCAFPV